MILLVGIVARLGFGRRDVSDRLEQASVVEPCDPFQGRELHGLQVPPRPPLPDDLGFVEAVDGLGQSVVIGVANAANGWFYARFS